MVSHFLSFSHFTQYQQFWKQSGNQFLLLNLSFKGWRPWEAWSIGTVLFFPYPLKKRVYKPLLWKHYPDTVYRSKMSGFGVFFNLSSKHFKRKMMGRETYLRVLHRQGPRLLGEAAGVHRRLLREPASPHGRTPKWDIKVSVVTLSLSYQRQTSYIIWVILKHHFPECGPLTTCTGITKDTV